MLTSWHIWIIAAIIISIFEILIPAFVLVSLGAGCLVASAGALLHLGINLQIGAFIVGALAAFFGIRPFFTRYCYRASPGVKTNADALAGKTGRVTEVIDEQINSGRVFVGGDDWKAISLDGSIIEKNSKVEVVRVEGAKVYVKPIQD